MFNACTGIKSWTFEHICIQFSSRIHLLRLSYIFLRIFNLRIFLFWRYYRSALAWGIVLSSLNVNSLIYIGNLLGNLSAYTFLKYDWISILHITNFWHFSSLLRNNDPQKKIALKCKFWHLNVRGPRRSKYKTQPNLLLSMAPLQ